MGLQTAVKPTELWIGQATADQAGITAAVDITGLTGGTLTLSGTQKIRIDVALGMDGSLITAIGQLTIYEDATIIRTCFVSFVNAGVTTFVNTFVRRVPSAGAHTYKATMVNLGSGTVTIRGAAGNPVQMVITALP